MYNSLLKSLWLLFKTENITVLYNYLYNLCASTEKVNLQNLIIIHIIYLCINVYELIARRFAFSFITIDLKNNIWVYILSTSYNTKYYSEIHLQSVFDITFCTYSVTSK